MNRILSFIIKPKKPQCDLNSNSNNTQTNDLITNPPKSIKVLAIGNSFSIDAMEYLYQILENAGVEKITLGNLYIGGCSLATHLENAKENKKAYKYYKNTNGKWIKHPKKSIKYAISNEKWDYITMQQASGYSGVASSYEDTLREMIEIVKSKKLQKTKLVWHATWAYQGDFERETFLKYDYNQDYMYSEIISAVRGQIVNNPNFEAIIPNTTAIQNARTSFLGDTLTRDGFHLSLDIGRYIAALTFYATLTGLSIENITFNPSPEVITADILKVIIESVTNAVKNPFSVTESKYKKTELVLSISTL